MHFVQRVTNQRPSSQVNLSILSRHKKQCPIDYSFAWLQSEGKSQIRIYKYKSGFLSESSGLRNSGLHASHHHEMQYRVSDLFSNHQQVYTFHRAEWQAIRPVFWRSIAVFRIRTLKLSFFACLINKKVLLRYYAIIIIHQCQTIKNCQQFRRLYLDVVRKTVGIDGRLLILLLNKNESFSYFIL